MRSVCTCSAEESGAHLISKVHDDEGRVGHTGFLKVGAAGVLLVELLSPVLIRPLWHLKQDAGYVRAFIEANRRRGGEQTTSQTGGRERIICSGELNGINIQIRTRKKTFI